MRRIQNLFLTTLLVLSATIARSATEYELVVCMTSGDKVSYQLSSQPVISFTSNQLVIESSEFSTSLQCDYDAVSRVLIKPLLATDDKPFTPSGGAANEIPDIDPVEYPEPDYGLTPIEKPFEDQSGLAGVMEDHRVSVSFTDGRTFHVSGINATAVIQVCDAAGRTVPADIVRFSRDTAAIQLGQLPAGVYLIRVNNQSFKIQKK